MALNIKGLFGKKEKKPKCAFCGKRIEGKPVFEKGMFFCTRAHLNAAKKKAKDSGKSEKEVCEFC